MWKLLAVVVLAGCGPYGSSMVGQTCDAGTGVQHCASPTTYAACDRDSFPTWREYPCAAQCAEGKSCDMTTVKAGDECPASWQGSICKSPRLAMACAAGKWVPVTCGECPAGATCFACSC